ncbi:hypothetical protein AKJ60_00340 [candidate division MSBL1 archaeon SCGC-AAA385M11]|nr:hypothetical protein AKJ60_00340 [candidate division MSBL1 archaeon SCGC-AAA385M11]
MAKKNRAKKQRQKIKSEFKEIPTKQQTTEQNFKSFWWEFVLACLLSYGTCVFFRFLEVPLWEAEQLKVNGGFLLATHDAYYWLASAKGTSFNPQASLGLILKFFRSLTNFSLENLAFWMPLWVAPLVALPLGVLTWWWRSSEAALTSGILGGGCLGYLLRTRVGFFDTDIASLFFAVGWGVGLLIWFEYIKNRSFTTKNEETKYFPKWQWLIWIVGLGVWGHIFFWFYHSGPKIALPMFLIIFALGIWQVKGKMKIWFALSMAALYAVSFGGWIAFVFGAALAFSPFVLAYDFFHKQHGIIALISLIVLAVLLGGMHNQMYGIIKALLSYAKLSPVEKVGNQTALELPSIKQSVREAQNINWSNIVNRTAGNWILFLAGIIGYLIVIWRKPAALVFLPFLAMSILSFKLGNRFAMFGGVPLGLGLGMGLSIGVKSFRDSRLLRWGLQIGLAIIVIWPLWDVAGTLKPSPILPQAYAKTLKSLNEGTSVDARLWQWWDYGYAAQYYAERMSMGDGSRHHGRTLFPLARIHSTQSSLQAAQIMEFVTLSQRRAAHKNASLKNPSLKWSYPYYAVDPVIALRDMGPEKAQAFVESLKTKERDWPDDLPAQYLVLSWENLRLAYWISFYGAWDLVTGQADPGRIQQVRGRVEFNMEKGLVKVNQRKIDMAGLAIISKEGTSKRKWLSNSQAYVVVNQLSKEMYIMDDTLYKSMMVQMLIGDPERFEEHFELVVDRYPWARAYRVR